MVDSPKSKKTSKKKGSRESGLPPKNEACSTSFRVRQFTNSWMTKSSKSITDDDDIWKLKPEDIHIDRLLGQGSFSTARLVYIRNPTTGHFESEEETFFVMKRLKTSVLEDELSFQMAASDIGIETRILASLRHTNILRLRGVKAGNMMDALRDGSFFLVVDWLVETLDVRLARWGTRKSLFRTQESSTIIRRLQDIALGIAEGMEYLHSKHILFRDLKPANIGFDQLGTVKIFDFGLSREYIVDEHGNPMAQCRQMTGGAGTPRYMAPEVAWMETNYGFGVDVYSFGILLWQIVTNKVPFSKIKSPPEFFQKVVAGNKRPKLKRISSNTLQQLIESCWSANPYLRPSFSLITKILRHMIDNRPSIRQSSLASARKSRRSSMIAIASNILAASSKSNIKKKRGRRHLSLPPSLSGIQQSGPLESHSTTSAVSASSAPDSDTSRSGTTRRRSSHRRMKRNVSLKLAASASLTQRSSSTYRSSSLSQRSLSSMVSPVVRRSKRDSLTERFMSWSRITPMPWANSTST